MIISHTIFIRYGILASVAKRFNCKIYILFPGNNDGLLNKLRLLKLINIYSNVKAIGYLEKILLSLKTKKKYLKYQKKIYIKEFLKEKGKLKLCGEKLHTN